MFDINNLQIVSNVDPNDLENAINKIKQDNNLKGLGPAFLVAEKDYKVNAIILASIACLESNYGKSTLANEKNNLFGLDAKDSLKGSDEYGSKYKSKADSVDHAGHRIGKQYIELDNNCKWRYVSAKDLHSVGAKWSSDKEWANKVSDIANRISNNIKGGNDMENNRLNEKTIGSAKVTVDILSKGYCVPNKKLASVGYITIHNTGSMAPAKNQHNYMKNINKSGERKASWHFSVDDKEIYQAQSCNYEMWHAGDTTGNRNSIGIEICQSDNKAIQEKIYRNAIELVKILMKYYNIPITKVVQHNKWSGKSCPDYLRRSVHGYSWNWFIDQCKGSSSTSNPSTGSKIKDGDYKNRKAKVVKVASNDVLNVRYSRDANATKVGQLKPGAIVVCQYCSKGWMSIDGFKGDKGLGYVNASYLELV